MPRRNARAREDRSPGFYAGRPSTFRDLVSVTMAAQTANEARVVTPSLALQPSKREGEHGQRRAC